MKCKRGFLFLAGVFFLLSACDEFNGRAAVLLTDRPEFALYAEQFNVSQDKYKVEVIYKNNIADDFYNTKSKEGPDIIAGSWLKSASTLKYWQSLEFLFRKNPELEKSFYPSLLALGRFDNRQYLLPVSFNLPIIIFSENNDTLIPGPFTIEPEEVKTLGKNFNEEKNNVYTRMGFSPLWNNNFLFETAVIFNASFREDDPLGWNEEELLEAIQYIRGWIDQTNGGLKAEDEFFFKYFFDPPQKLVIANRILFAYMNSSAFFTMSNETQTNLDFRMLSGGGLIPVSEDAVYYGLSKKGNSKNAAREFTVWFFREETQMLLLEKSREKHLSDTIFGIANGFSALHTVNENIFPLYYPMLLGHMPPADLLTAPNILPKNWMDIKERVVIPCLRDACRGENDTPLKQRLDDWMRINNSSFNGGRQLVP
ncbi:MAG: extracellular solute-binding protein [Spirochaetaceae bacterium]|jgi:ABC-type glycerol-3-phosphate transport system substrate-binding protein|nr:extracellular solute-binding protein [Spirochaetaceae bacterium]